MEDVFRGWNEGRYSTALAEVLPSSRRLCSSRSIILVPIRMAKSSHTITTISFVLCLGTRLLVR